MNSQTLRWMAAACLVAAVHWPRQAQASGETIHVSENFDSMTVGSPPTGWSSGGLGSGLVAVTNNLAVSAPNSLALVYTNSNGYWTYALKSFSASYIPANSDRKVDVDFRVNFSRTNANEWILLQDSGGASFLRLRFTPQGELLADTNGFNAATVGTYTSNLWYDVNIHFVPMEQTYDVTLSTNGTTIGSVNDLPMFSSLLFSTVYFQHYGGSGGPIWYVDDVRVTSIPEPSSLALAATGIVGLRFWRRRSR